jgi:hypothetical protein
MGVPAAVRNDASERAVLMEELKAQQAQQIAAQGVAAQAVANAEADAGTAQ